jgi:DNA-directed RNA polymerase beta' subunit
LSVSSIVWFFSADEIEKTEEGTFVNIDIGKYGARTYRFIPTMMSSAKYYFEFSPDAEGLRARRETLRIAEIHVGQFEPTTDPVTGEPNEMPATFYETPIVEDYSEKYPQYMIDGVVGIVAKTPMNFRAKVRKLGDYLWEPKKLSKLNMTMMSPEQVEQMSVLEVIESESRVEGLITSPIPNGPLDPRLGATDKDAQCATCGGFQSSRDDNVSNSCEGHFGHISLPTPIPNYLYLTGGSPAFDRALNLVCHNCSLLNVDPDILTNRAMAVTNLLETKKKNVSLMREINKVSGGKVENFRTCRHCNYESPKLSFNVSSHRLEVAPYKEDAGYRRSDNSIQYYPYDVAYDILAAIPDEHALAMGFELPNRPEYMFLRNLPVLPNTARPTRERYDGGRDEDDLTEMYSEVVEQAAIYRQDRNSSDRTKIDLAANLFKRVTQCLTNADDKVGTFSTRLFTTKSGLKTGAYRGSLDRIVGMGNKGSRFRRDLLSKSTKNAIRSVISPNGDLSINQVGIPYEACFEMDLAEVVSEDNIEALRKLVRKGVRVEQDLESEYGLIREPDFYYNHIPTAKRIKPFGRNNSIELTDMLYWNWNSKDLAWAEGDENGLLRDGRRAKSRGWFVNNAKQDTPLALAWEEHKNENIREWLRDLPPEDKTAKVFYEQKKFAVEYNTNRRMQIADNLRVGDTVVRTLSKGDLVLFNRMPSLHKHSINAMRVVPMNQKSISFNPAICVPFNADFDGDTMNVYVVSGREAQEELEEKVQLRKNLIHSRTGKMIIGTDHDQTSGIYLLTIKNKPKAGTFSGDIGYTEEGLVYFTKRKVMQILSKVHTRDDEGNRIVIEDIGKPSYKRKYWTGYDLISLLIPDGINARFKCGTLYDEDGKMQREPAEDNDYWRGEHLGKPIKDELIIRNGRLIQGTLDKTFMGKEKASLAPSFYYLFGYEEGSKQMQRFIDMLCSLGFAAHHAVGYTMGVADCGLEAKSDSDGRRIEYDDIDVAYENVSALCTEIEFDFRNYNMSRYIFDDNFLPNYTKTEKRDMYEKTPYEFRQKLLIEATSKWEETLASYVSDNSMVDSSMEVAVRSGARGKEDNIQQMAGGYGLCLVSGGMIVKGLNKDRLLPHFPLHNTPMEHPTHLGFIKNSYYRGLEPHEYYFASIAGRRSLYESGGPAVAKSGYLARVIRRSLENIVVDEEQRVIDVRDGSIVSYRYGDDGYKSSNSRQVASFPDAGHIINERGGLDVEQMRLSLELVPFLMEHSCKHGTTLEGDCKKCTKGSAHVDFFIKSIGIESPLLISNVASVLEQREVMKPVVVSMIASLKKWHEENIIDSGSAVGSSAGGNIAEPATQSSLRAFHGGGKGAPTSVAQLERLLKLEKGLGTVNGDNYTYFALTDNYNTPEKAEEIAQWVTPYYLSDIVDEAVVNVDGSIDFALSSRAIEDKKIDTSFVFRQIRRRVKGTERINAFDFDWEDLDVHFFRVKPVAKDVRDIIRNSFNVRNYMLGLQISGLRGSSAAFTRQEEDGRWWVAIRSGSPTLWESILTHLDDIADIDTIWSDNPISVKANLGLEAGLLCLEQTINYQMNSDNGIGEFDWRYIRTICDYVGKNGEMEPLGDRGTDKTAINTLDAMAMGGIKKNIVAGAMLKSDNNMNSVTASTLSGNPVPIGREYEN